MDTLVANISQVKRQNSHITKNRGEKEDITAPATEIQRIIRNDCEKLYDKKLDSQKKLTNF